MKVCIIGHTERNYLPYMDKYTNFFDENNIQYDIICWQREEKPLNSAPNEINYCEDIKEGAINKIISYLKYKKFVIDILEKNKYDKLVILTTMPAIFLRKYLLKNYKNKYLFDFRDYSFEKYSPYKKMVDELIENSEFTTISSAGFMDFLSLNKKIIMNHNIPLNASNIEATELKDKQLINIGFVGGVRYYDENVSLIEQLKNSFRFQLWYIGKPIPACDLQSYCKENDIKNVSFVGKYDNSQKAELYKNIDMINSIYGNASLEVTTALPNRLYEACLYKKPIISSKGTFLGEVIHQYKLGLAVDVEHDDVVSMIDDYLKNYDKDSFHENCEKFLAEVQKDEENLKKCLKKFIKQK